VVSEVFLGELSMDPLPIEFAMDEDLFATDDYSTYFD
jgi:hypothetical protein